MAELKYTVSSGTPGQSPSLLDSDSLYSGAVTLNSQFNTATDYIEVSVFDQEGNFIRVHQGVSQAKELLNSNSVTQEGTSVIYLDPLTFSKSQYPTQNVQLVYSFLRKLEPQQFFISELSPDRLEVKLKPTNSVNLNRLQDIVDAFNATPYAPKFILELSPTEKVLVVNLKYEGDRIILKLYNPLEYPFGLKSQVRLLEEIADDVTYTVSTYIDTPPQKAPVLRGPNFSIELEDQSDLSTEYFDYTELFSYPITGSYNKITSHLSSSNSTLNVDYSRFEEFVHFSSAKERLINFKYKLDLLQSYEAAQAVNTAISNAATAVQKVDNKYDALIKGILTNFDGYEHHLYFNSGSTTWPKVSSTKPYINQSSTTIAATNWFEDTLASASLYDELNESKLTYTIPEYLRQDDANNPYSLFVDMVGQHFDNLWIYAKEFTSKYDADNRLDYGISKELLTKTLQNFGVKLYSSNFSTAELSKLLLGEWYNSGSESINTFVTASNEPTPDSDILNETYKRIYHNLPYLIKTKGTERGLRALINCFGVPSTSIQIRTFGGLRTDLDFAPGYSYPALPEEKIRLSNTGSLIPGQTLSQYASIIKPNNDYNQDLHTIEVGFSPSYYVDEYIVNYTLPPSYVVGTTLEELSSTPGYRIDDYIGDPRNVGARRYVTLNKLRDTLLQNLERYDVYDFVRLIKFFDNQLFKMIRDFVPGRDTVSTGIIIKPHLLDRSKTGEPIPTAARYEYSASIDTAFIEGSEPGVIHNFSVAHSESISTALGYVNEINDTEVEKINGELGGTVIEIGLTGENNFLQYVQPRMDYSVVHYTDYKDFADIEIPSSLFAGDIRIYVEAQIFIAPGELPEIPLDPSEPIGTPIPITITGLKDTCGKGSGTVKVGASTVSNITANSGTSTVTISTTPVNVNSGDTVTLTLLAEGPTGAGCQQAYSSQTRARIIVNGTTVALALSETIDTATYTFTPTASTTVQFSYIQIPV